MHNCLKYFDRWKGIIGTRNKKDMMLKNLKQNAEIEETKTNVFLKVCHFRDSRVSGSANPASASVYDNVKVRHFLMIFIMTIMVIVLVTSMVNIFL